MERQSHESAGQADGLRPEPVRAPWLSAAGAFAVSAALLVGAGFALPPLFTPPVRTCGAPRTVHLERQKRQQRAREAAEREAPAVEGVAHGAEGPGQ